MWFDRDLPVLKAVVKLADESDFVQASKVDKVTELPEKEVNAALKALNDGGFFTKVSGDMQRRIDLVYGVTGYARQVAGVWPTAQVLAEDLVTQLEKQADAETDPEKKSRIKGFLKGTGQAGREIAVDVMASVVKAQMGI